MPGGRASGKRSGDGREPREHQQPVAEIERTARRGLARPGEGTTTSRSRSYGEEKRRRPGRDPPAPIAMADMILRVLWVPVTRPDPRFQRGCPPSLELLAVAKAMASSLRDPLRGCPSGAVALECGPLYFCHGLLGQQRRLDHEAGSEREGHARAWGRLLLQPVEDEEDGGGGHVAVFGKNLFRDRGLLA